MKSDGAGSEVGTFAVNGIEYLVIKDERQEVTINHEKVSGITYYFKANVEEYIMKHQKMTAWQKTQHGFDDFDIIMDDTTMYAIGEMQFFVHRAYDATCWQYYTGDENEYCQWESPWYPAEIQPSADHFTQWIISSIEVK